MSTSADPDNPWLQGLAPAAAERRAADYAARFDRLAATGADVHGEAHRVHQLVAPLAPHATIVDAGCGTGRVGAQLATLGHQVCGLDLDAAMLQVARTRTPQVPWLQLDLTQADRSTLLAALPTDTDPQLRARLAQGAHCVVAAGNVMPLLTPGTEVSVLRNLTDLLAPGGVLVAGFGLTRAHLPALAPQDPLLCDLAVYDDLCAQAGLTLAHRWSDWAGQAYDGAGYAVSVHQLPN